MKRLICRALKIAPTALIALMAAQVPLRLRFNSNLKRLVSALKETAIAIDAATRADMATTGVPFTMYSTQFPTVEFMLTLAMSADQTFDYLIQGFITNSYKTWDKILIKEEAHFVANVQALFGNIESAKQYLEILVDIITRLNPQGQPYLTATRRAEMWDIVHGLVKMSIKYMHLKSGPVMGPEGMGYTVDFMPNYDFETAATQWNVVLDMNTC